MSIPDDPFNTMQPNTERPALGISTGLRLEHEHTEPIRDYDGPSHVNAHASSSTGHHTPAILIAPSSAGTGTKTPRRVQWNNESHVVQLEPIPLSPQTVDRSNLNAIDAALEMHRTRSSAPRDRRPQSPLSNASTDQTDGVADYDYRLDVDPPRTHRHSLAPPHPTAPLEAVGSTDSQRADHAEPQSLSDILDTGINEHVYSEANIPMGEMDGLPNVVSNDAHDEMNAAKDLVRAHTGKWGVLRRRVRGAGAVSRAFGGGAGGMGDIQENGTGDAEKRGPTDDAVASTSLARANTGRASAEQNSFAARYPEPGHDGANLRVRASFSGGMGNGTGGINGMNSGMPAMPGGASVLSSLLALYNQQNGMQSGTTSAASSRPSSLYETSDEEEDEKARTRAAQSEDVKKTAGGWWHPGQGNGHDGGSSNETPPDVVINVENRRPSEVMMDDAEADAGAAGEGGLPRPQRAHSTSSLTADARPTPNFLSALKSARKLTEKASSKIGSQLDDADRPKAARSGAGVWGALIQNTQNISGAAAPIAATLAPAAARPGYQLNRYTLPTAEAVTQASSPWRPTPRLSSRPPSRPTSVHSGTAVGDSPLSAKDKDEGLKKNYSASDLRPNTSSDDMLSMRPSRGGALGYNNKPESIRSRSGLKLDSLGRQAIKSSGQALKTGGQAVRNAEKWVLSGGKTPLITPPGEKGGDSYFGRPLSEDERRRKEWEAEKRKRKKAKEARKKQEIFIIQHVAAILARQQFLMKLARALMMFGSPSHRLETQIQATARVLEINAQVVYLPGTMLISFGDDATHTSETKFLKQATGLDLGKLLATHKLYWNVVHDRISVDQASKDLDVLMTTPLYYSWWQTLIIGAMASAFICIVGFSGSFIDALAAAILGSLLCAIQMLAARNDMFSNVFEIAIATIISFIAAGLASTNYFCYTAIVSGGVVLILPGYIVLCGALELAARNITAGAVRIGYSVIYSLFLGFGISIGAELYRQITGLTVAGANDYQCSVTHNSDMWYQVTPSQWWYFLACPGFALALSLRNQQPLFARELPIMILIACAGWASNHFAARAFVNRSDMTSAIGSFVVGTLGNLYGKLSKGSSFPVTVVGILFQLPSGLSNGGIFNFASQSGEGNLEAYSSGFEVAQQLVSVAIGLTVGLFVSAAITHPFGGGRRRGSGIFSF